MQDEKKENRQQHTQCQAIQHPEANIVLSDILVVYWGSGVRQGGCEINVFGFAKEPSPLT